MFSCWDDRRVDRIWVEGLSSVADVTGITARDAEDAESAQRVDEKGKRADLVLLDANPLEDIANTQKRTGVILKGKYLTQAEMNQWFDQIAPRFQHALDENT